ncbi:MAG TPA: Xaa-Pro peptidase family protein [Terriglobales bacterium]|nr:Xaa-Pro peptidase family protein [Terriglobales bacterium]
MNLTAIQAALRERKFDAWLFYDHHHRDPLAYSILGLPEKMHVTRRWYYLIPADGEPVKLNHRVEPKHLESLPGKQLHYGPWPEMHQRLREMLAPYQRVAMQYSPNNNIMYISLVDGGTLELLRSFDVDIASSADLVAQFEATLTAEQIATHFEARDKVDPIMQAAFREIGERVRSGGWDEYGVQQWLGEAFKRENLVWDDLPIVGVNENAGNPHYSPTPETSKPIRQGDWVLLDMWAKVNKPGAVYYDITWTGFVGNSPPDKHREIFEIVTGARNVGINTVKDAFTAKRKIMGWEVDAAVRAFIEKTGYGQYFVHRTGHSIGTEVHGNGANMDNLETKDEREIIPNTLFSIEPGIYLPEFGVRAEIDMLVRNGGAEVTGKIQNEIVII